MIKGKAFLAAAVVSLGLLVTGVSSALAVDGTEPPVTVQATFRYPIKFVCGTMAPLQGTTTDASLPLTRGVYHTAINVHNPSVGQTPTGAPQSVTFAKKVAVASSTNADGVPTLPQTPGRVTQFIKATLKPNEAFEIDCREISELTGVLLDSGYIKGFVVIMSPVELDVTAVYTARPNAATPDGVSTMDVEVIQPKTIRPPVPVRAFPLLAN